MTALIVIGGPTASGKSALALRLAEAVGGMIINADSMQLYRDLRILTARPTPEDEARVPHRLYGVLDAEDPASAGRWLELAGIAIGEARAEGRPAIVVGGTGLYLHALLHGIAPVPEIPAAVQSAARARFAALGAPAFHAELAKRDPAMAARLRPSDRQRLIRAYEVVVGTGRSLAAWQAAPPVRVELPMPRIGIALTPPRAALYERIGAPPAQDDRARGARRARRAAPAPPGPGAAPDEGGRGAGVARSPGGPGRSGDGARSGDRSDASLRQAATDLAAPSASRAATPSRRSATPQICRLQRAPGLVDRSAFDA